MLYACDSLLHTKWGWNSCPPLFTIFLCRFEIFKIFVQVVIEPDVDSALRPVAPTGKFFLGQIHTWGSFLTYLTLIQTTFKILLALTSKCQIFRNLAHPLPQPRDTMLPTLWHFSKVYPTIYYPSVPVWPMCHQSGTAGAH